ncbi:MAG: lipocalin family protein [Ferruginibacter sp.]
MKKIVIILLLSSIASCANTENNKLIVGNWSANEWLIDGNPSNRDTEGTHFTFDDKANYTFSYSGTVEKGTYKVENNMLFTKPDNQQEIMVKITKLTTDSLVFDMNRSGTAEILTLLKDK